MSSLSQLKLYLKKGRTMPEAIAEMDLSELAGILSSSSHGRFGLAKA